MSREETEILAICFVVNRYTEAFTFCNFCLVCFLNYLFYFLDLLETFAYLVSKEL